MSALADAAIAAGATVTAEGVFANGTTLVKLRWDGRFGGYIASESDLASNMDQDRAERWAWKSNNPEAVEWLHLHAADS